MIAGIVLGLQLTDLSLDPRLQKPIEIRAEAESVGAVIPSIGKRLNVALDASVSIKDDLIILYAKQKPAFEVLQKIAGHFGWEWQKAGEGYKLVQPEKAKKDEQAKLDEQLSAPYKEFQKTCKAALDDAAAFSDETLTNEIQKAQAQVQALSKGGTAGEIQSVGDLDSPASKAERRLKYLRTLHNPIATLTRKVAAQMSPADLRFLRDHERIVFSTLPTAWQRPFPEGVESQIAKAITQASAQNEDRRALNFETLRTFTPDDVKTVRVQISAKRSGAERSLSCEPRLVMTAQDGSVLAEASDYDYVYPPAPPAQADVPNDERLTRQIDQNSAIAPFRDDPKKMLDLVGSTLASASKPDSKEDLLHLFGVKLTAIAEAADVALIGDCYDAYVLSNYLPLSKRTAKENLDMLAARNLFGWNLSGDWIQLRSPIWQLRRFETVPREVLRKFKDGESFATVSLSTLIDVSTALNDAQAWSPIWVFACPAWWQNLFASGLRPVYVLRAVAQMSAIQRTEFIRGRPFYGRELPPTAAPFLNEAVYRTKWDNGFVGSMDSPTAEPAEREYVNREWNGLVLNADGTYSRSDTPKWKDCEITQLLPEGSTAGVLLSCKAIEVSGVIARLNNGYQKVMRVSRLAESERAPDPLGLNPNFFKPCTIESVFFTMRLPSSEARGLYVETSRVDPAATWHSRSDLPEETLNSLSFWKKRLGGSGGGSF
jgi:hypothetical protein